MRSTRGCFGVDDGPSRIDLWRAPYAMSIHRDRPRRDVRPITRSDIETAAQLGKQSFDREEPKRVVGHRRRRSAVGVGEAAFGFFIALRTYAPANVGYLAADRSLAGLRIWKLPPRRTAHCRGRENARRPIAYVGCKMADLAASGSESSMSNVECARHVSDLTTSYRHGVELAIEPVQGIRYSGDARQYSPQSLLCFTSLLLHRDVNSGRTSICARPPRADQLAHGSTHTKLVQ
ncbi:UNVERIFIED_ORG: hypothetical protein ABIC62_006129 [Burkholderia sp. 1595]|uniref:Uncharacterized protein n=1 Tax=Paraburkholderia terricola TaxID=169427 RepID=A0ABU1M187_9BURK|nr:hypothetical protein [Paraburkholderia terricola]